MRAKKSEVPKIVHTAIKVLSPSGRAIFYDSVRKFNDDEKKQFESIDLSDKIGEVINGKDLNIVVIAITTALANVYMSFNIEKIENDLREQDAEEKRMFG